MSVRLNPTRARLVRITADLKGARLFNGMTAAASVLATEARRYAPVATGALRASIRVAIQREAAAITATVGSPLPYAALVEYGNRPTTRARRGRRPQPYLGRALSENRARIIAGIETTVRESVRTDA